MTKAPDLSAKNHFNVSFPKTVKRLPPMSIRLSEHERETLIRLAGDMPLSSYVKAVVFAGGKPIRLRRTHAPVEDKKALSKALGLLGQSRIASNLNQLAKAANIGTLPLSPDVEDDLKTACAQVQDIRRLLIEALGMQS